jgi:glycosyltransferase involved in cell wall biosynthesis
MISVIIPTYNRANTISKAIDSVFAQNHDAIEIIVVDDGSTDNTSTVLESFRHRILLIRQNNQGVAAARNTGVSVAQGEYVAFLDSDDEWLPSKLEKQLLIFQNDPEVSLVATGAEFRDKNGEILNIQSANFQDLRLEDLLFSNTIVTSSVIMKRYCFQEEQPLFRREYSSCEDWDLWIRLSTKVKICVIGDILVCHRETRDSLFENTATDIIADLYRRMIRESLQNPMIAPIVKRHWSELMANSDVILAYYAYLRGDQSTARKSLIRSILAAPKRVKLATAFAVFFLPRSTFFRLKRWRLNFRLNKQNSYAS